MRVRKNFFWLSFNIIFLWVIASIIFNITINFREISVMKTQEEREKLDISNLKTKYNNLEKDLNNLDKNETIEKIARDKLNMKKNGEVIYRVMKKTNRRENAQE